MKEVSNFCHPNWKSRAGERAWVEQAAWRRRFVGEPLPRASMINRAVPESTWSGHGLGFHNPTWKMHTLSGPLIGRTVGATCFFPHLC